MAASAALSEAGNAVLVGHRDTHFSAIENLTIADLIDIQFIGGSAQF
jgi:sortase (surface protein transpeptidase)